MVSRAFSLVAVFPSLFLAGCGDTYSFTSGVPVDEFEYVPDWLTCIECEDGERDAIQLYFGSDDSSVYAIDPGTGNKLWEFKTGGRIASKPVIKGDHLYASSADGLLYKLRIKTGELAWKIETGTLVLSGPYVNDDAIYIANNQGEVFSLDNKGNTLWKRSVGAPVYSPVNGDKDSILPSLVPK